MAFGGGSHTAVEANSVSNAVRLNTVTGGSVNAIHVINTAAANGFLQVFDLATAAEATLGTTLPRYVLAVTTSSVAEGLVGANAQFINGIVVACTTTAVGSTTAVAHVRVWVS